MSPQNDPPQNNDEPRDVIAKALKAVTLEHLAPSASQAAKTGSDHLVNRTIARAEEAAQRAKDAEAELASSVQGWIDPNKPKDPSIARLTDRGIEIMDPNATAEEMLDAIGWVPNPAYDAELTAALDLIGRRTDVVAVKLPEPDDPSTWEYEFCSAMWSGFEDIDGEDGLDIAAFPSSDVWAGSVEIGVARYAPDVARRIGAAIFAAAARADAANVADATDGA